MKWILGIEYEKSNHNFVTWIGASIAQCGFYIIKLSGVNAQLIRIPMIKTQKDKD